MKMVDIFATADKWARRMGSRFVPHVDQIEGPCALCGGKGETHFCGWVCGDVPCADCNGTGRAGQNEEGR